MTRLMRSAAVLVVATALLAPSTLPAGATAGFRVHQHNTHAAALWHLRDRHHTIVHLVAYAATRNQYGGRPQTTGGSMFAEVSQTYCDRRAHQRVERYWFGAVPASVSVSRDSRAAGWTSATLLLRGQQTMMPLRHDGCDSWRWRDATFKKLPKVQLVTSGSMTAAGSMVTDNTSRRDVYGASRYLTVSVGAARMATEVHVSMSSAEPRLRALRSLPTPDVAYIGRTGRMETTVLRGPGHNSVGGGSSG